MDKFNNFSDLFIFKFLHFSCLVAVTALHQGRSEPLQALNWPFRAPDAPLHINLVVSQRKQL